MFIYFHSFSSILIQIFIYFHPSTGLANAIQVAQLLDTLEKDMLTSDLQVAGVTMDGGRGHG